MNFYMFFELSKILWAIAMPLNALCLLILLGWVVRKLIHDKAGRVMITTGVITILVFAILPIGPMMVTWLERQYPPTQELPEQVDGIIVLGGMFETYLSNTFKRISMNDQVDRMVCFADLVKKYPKARKIFSGGPGDFLHPGVTESSDAIRFLGRFAFELEERRIVFEESSRNTYENVVKSKESIMPQEGENWIVITSGYHMPRTMGIFAKQDWPVIPYACDLKTDGTYNPFTRMPNAVFNFEMLNIAVKEILGSIIYRITGKSAFILKPPPIALSYETDLS